MADSYLFELKGQTRVGKIHSITEEENQYQPGKMNIIVWFELVTKDGRPATNLWSYRFPKPSEGGVSRSKWGKFIKSFNSASKKAVKSFDDMLNVYCRIEDKESEGTPQLNAETGETEARTFTDYVVVNVYKDVDEARAALGAKSATPSAPANDAPFATPVAAGDAATFKLVWSGTGAVGNQPAFEAAVQSFVADKGYAMADMIKAAKS